MKGLDYNSIMTIKSLCLIENYDKFKVKTVVN